jgi:hypothetical protein
MHTEGPAYYAAIPVSAKIPAPIVPPTPNMVNVLLDNSEFVLIYFLSRSTDLSLDIFSKSVCSLAKGFIN